MSTQKAPILRTSQLAKVYGAVVAVNRISFDIRQGEVCALLGGNGAGKTTTLAMILGLLIPTSGDVEIWGHNIRHSRFRVLGRMNFSSPYVDLPMRLSVAENLRVYGHLYGVARVQHRIAELATDLDLQALLGRPYGTLSAGQKTRVALAKALLNRPELLLLDEPTASLDPDTADHIRGYLLNYQQRSSATILMASHNMVEVERICTSVIMLRAGEIVATGSPAELLHRYGRANMEEVFLDMARTGGEQHE